MEMSFTVLPAFPVKVRMRWAFGRKRLDAGFFARIQTKPEDCKNGPQSKNEAILKGLQEILTQKHT